MFIFSECQYRRPSAKASGLDSFVPRYEIPKPSETKKKRGEHILLTEAALPGTTQEMITVEQLSLGFRVIDTPGIPSAETVVSRMDSFIDLAKLLP